MIYLRKCDDVSGCGKTYPGDLDDCPNCGAQHAFSDVAHVNPLDYAYDIETYPNIFTCRFIHIATDTRWRFEISDRINQIEEFVAFVIALKNCGARGVGYNNDGFDYPVVHYIMNNQWVAVILAVIGNSFLTVIKFAAFLGSGSGAMMSEAIHSLADTGNQGLLWLGIRRSERPADTMFNWTSTPPPLLHPVASQIIPRETRLPTLLRIPPMPSSFANRSALTRIYRPSIHLSRNRPHGS